MKKNLTEIIPLKDIEFILLDLDGTLLDTMSESIVTIRPCTRNDPSFFKLTQMSDNIVGYLTPSSGDGMTRIPFYQSAPARANWVLIGGIMVHDLDISADLVADDGTNYKVITVRMRFASKL